MTADHDCAYQRYLRDVVGYLRISAREVANDPEAGDLERGYAAAHEHILEHLKLQAETIGLDLAKLGLG